MDENKSQVAYRILGRSRRALAIAMRWRCPPESMEPLPKTEVLNPCGRDNWKNSSWSDPLEELNQSQN